jgi:hypothetical protein
LPCTFYTVLSNLTSEVRGLVRLICVKVPSYLWFNGEVLVGPIA